MADEITIPECPECDKLHKVSELSNQIGTFLDWLSDEQDIHLGSRHEHTDECRGDDGFISCGYRNGELVLIHESFEKLLARYFDIDLKKVEEERRALLEVIRANNEARAK